MIGPIATDLILIDGLSIRYAVDRRVSTGTPILLTTPFPESVFAFLPVWEDFAALGPVIAVDLPGFGRSEARQDLMSPSAMGEFLIKILDAFELERVHAVRTGCRNAGGAVRGFDEPRPVARASSPAAGA